MFPEKGIAKRLSLYGGGGFFAGLPIFSSKVLPIYIGPLKGCFISLKVAARRVSSISCLACCDIPLTASA
jgi:hypothetical protein